MLILTCMVSGIAYSRGQRGISEKDSRSRPDSQGAVPRQRMAIIGIGIYSIVNCQIRIILVVFKCTRVIERCIPFGRDSLSAPSLIASYRSCNTLEVLTVVSGVYLESR